jgi:hypothetical protein
MSNSWCRLQLLSGFHVLWPLGMAGDPGKVGLFEVKAMGIFYAAQYCTH